MRSAVVRVAEAKSRDVGHGIVRIDPLIAERLNITTGDTVEIIGKRRTVALSWYGYPEDRGKQIIRIDGATRRNAGSESTTRQPLGESRHAQRPKSPSHRQSTSA